MGLAVLICRLLLVGVFALAAATKLADRPGTRKAVVEFGVPDSLADAVTLALPAAELLVAALLLPGPVAWLGGLGSVLLLLAFCAAITVNLVRGNQPDCHCFGQVHSEPISPWTLGRNAVLIAVGVFVAVEGRVNRDGSAFHTLGQVGATGWIQVAAGAAALGLLAAQVWILYRLQSRQDQVLIRLKMIEADLRSGAASSSDSIDEEPEEEEPEFGPGSLAPAFSLTDLTGEMVTLDDLLGRGKTILMIFAHPACTSCDELLTQVARWQREFGSRLEIPIISGGSVLANQRKGEKAGITGILLQKKREVEEAYGAAGVPSAVVVRPDGTLGSPIAGGFDEIVALFDIVLQLVHESVIPVADNGRQLAPGHSRIPWPDVFVPAPSLRLPDLTGREVDLDEFRGQRVMVLFWSTSCYHCNILLPSLLEWEENRPPGAPRLVVAAAGPEDEIREFGFRSTVLLDPEYSASEIFGAYGVPLAALIDADGTYVTRIAGEEDILGVLRDEIPWPVAATPA